MSVPQKPRVFVVQQPAYFDRELKRFVPKYDLTPVKAHGDIVYLLGPGNIFRDRIAQARDQIKKKLLDFSEDDFLLTVGDPVAITLAVMIAAENTDGLLKILKWDRIGNAYDVFSVAS